MNKLYLSLFLVLGLSVPAAAADIPSQPIEPMRQSDILPQSTSQDQFTWTGLYGGLEDGISGSHTSYDFSGGTTAKHKGDGALAGLRLGYNYALGNDFIAGAEVNVNGSTDNGSTPCVGETANCGHKVRSFGSVDARMGYAQDRFLFTGSAGLAYANIKYTTTPYNGYAATATGSSSNNMFGWTIGAGTDYAVTDHILLSVGYKYYSFNKKTVNAGVLDTNAVQIRPVINALTTGVSYKF